MKNIKIELLDENDFNKKRKALRMYNMTAYKQLEFDVFKSLRHGRLPGKEVDRSSDEKTIFYEVELITDRLFKKVYGPLKLHYTAFEDKNYVLLTDITPAEILIAGHTYELDTYKGVPIRGPKDIKKVDFMLKMEGMNGKR